MADDDVQNEDMGISRSAAPGISSEEELLLDSLMDGGAVDELPADLQRVQAVLAAASAPATLDELAGLGAALAAHDRMMVAQPGLSSRRKPVAVGIAAALATVLLGATGAAYAGALPDSIQDFAHRTIGAPESDASGSGGSGGSTPGQGQPGGPAAPPGAGQPGSVVPGASATSAPRASAGQTNGGGTTTAPGQTGESGQGNGSGQATPPGQIKRTTKATPPGQVDNPGKATPPGQVQRTATSKPTQASSNNGNSGNGNANSGNPNAGKGNNSGKNNLAPSDGASGVQ